MIEKDQDAWTAFGEDAANYHEQYSKPDFASGYHTSGDNPEIITDDNLTETLDVFVDLWDALESNFYPRRTFVGPVMLSRGTVFGWTGAGIAPSILRSMI